MGQDSMEIEECKFKVRCELGACKNRAENTVKFDRVGIKSRMHICRACMQNLHDAIAQEIKDRLDNAAECDANRADADGSTAIKALKTANAAKSAKSVKRVTVAANDTAKNCESAQ